MSNCHLLHEFKLYSILHKYSIEMTFFSFSTFLNNEPSGSSISFCWCARTFFCSCYYSFVIAGSCSQCTKTVVLVQENFLHCSCILLFEWKKKRLRWHWTRLYRKTQWHRQSWWGEQRFPFFVLYKWTRIKTRSTT